MRSRSRHRLVGALIGILALTVAVPSVQVSGAWADDGSVPAVPAAAAAGRSGAVPNLGLVPAGVAGAVLDRPGRKPGPPRVLLLGDSVLDQLGNAAAVTLRQAGADVRVDGRWGTALLNRWTYDYGKIRYATRDEQGRPVTNWLVRGRYHVGTFDPDVTVVALNYNYWPPRPRDPAGREILPDTMGFGIARMRLAAALTAELRANGGEVVFAAPHGLSTEAGTTRARLWFAWYVFGAAAAGARISVSTMEAVTPGWSVEQRRPDCRGRLVHTHADGLHLTTFGSSRSGLALARDLAPLIELDLAGTTAPGQAVVGLVPGRQGYRVLACDGGVFGFGPRFLGGGKQLASVGSDVRAGAAPTERRGFWLVRASGRIDGYGPGVSLTRGQVLLAPGEVPIAATAPPGSDGDGLWVLVSSGRVLPVGATGGLPSAPPRPGERPVGLGAAGTGAWVLFDSGRVVPLGGAPAVPVLWPTGSGPAAGRRVAAIAPTPDGSGYWLVDVEGGVGWAGSAEPVVGVATGEVLAGTSGRRYATTASRAMAGEPKGTAGTGLRAVTAALARPEIVGATAVPDGPGLWAVARDGRVWALGGAPDLGDAADLSFRELSVW